MSRGICQRECLKSQTQSHETAHRGDYPKECFAKIASRLKVDTSSAGDNKSGEKVHEGGLGNGWRDFQLPNHTFEGN
jgi:hypothetical protein